MTVVITTTVNTTTMMITDITLNVIVMKKHLFRLATHTRRAGLRLNAAASEPLIMASFSPALQPSAQTK